MKYEPWARFTTRMTPKISERPLARRNRSAPYDTPLNVCVIQNSLLTRAARRSARDGMDSAMCVHAEVERDRHGSGFYYGLRPPERPAPRPARSNATLTSSSTWD